MEVCSDLLSMSLDAIGQCAFGYKFNALESSLKKTDDESGTTHSFQRMMSVVGLSWKMMLPFWDKLPFEDVRKMNADSAMVQKTVFKVINQKKAQLEQEEEKLTHDLLDKLVLARDEETGKGLSDLELKDQVMTFLLAGHETTSIGLSWILLQMANHPECQQKVRQEVQEILPKDGTPISWDDLDKLKYTHAVIKETLRLLPPVPLTLRQAVNDDVICGYFIPAGTIILLCPGVMMRQQDSFDDPLKFNPDRFMNETNATNPNNFIPFLLGPRMCIGHKFAMAQMKLILAMVVREFQLALDPVYTYKRKQRITMRPDPSLSLRVSPVDKFINSPKTF
ncbi:unnamed protein product [Owenia fusiformis]|uniref:Cytochrome P450 n=1 Tax=Owenia fusiformis TaxID=6347 RepID=A0A8S4NZU0_OWEFU|nr:unnamed protein product [Owenia fusiformis]